MGQNGTLRGIYRPLMGEIKVEIELENFGDRYLFLQKKSEEERIRQYKIKALVDTGAVILSLPQEVVEKLGLVENGKVIVTYVDERKKKER